MTKAEYMREYRARHPGDAALRERNRRHGVKVTRTCKLCGKEFVVDVHHRRFCSSECQIEYNRRSLGCVPSDRVLEPRPCAWCGHEFTPVRPNQHFCKKSCRNHASEKKRATERRAARPELQPHEVTCKYCGQSFSTDNPRKRFCSDKCCDLFAKYHCSKAEHEAKKANLEKTCKFCGKTFTASPNSPNAQYCCEKCRCYSKRWESPEQRDQALESRRAKAEASKKKDTFGLTAAQRQAVIDAQDGDRDTLWRLSQTWTPAQRKFAKKRYEEIHGTFSQTFRG